MSFVGCGALTLQKLTFCRLFRHNWGINLSKWFLNIKMIIYDTNVIANDYEVGNKKIKQVKWAGADDQIIIIMVAIILAMMQNRQLMIINSCIIERRSVLFSKWSTKYNWLCCLYQELVAKISISVVRQITLFEIKLPGPSVCLKCNFITAFEQLLSPLHCFSHVCVCALAMGGLVQCV